MSESSTSKGVYRGPFHDFCTVCTSQREWETATPREHKPQLGYLSFRFPHPSAKVSLI
jgi:hypothetical protein